MSLDRITCPSCGASRFEHDSEGNLICAHCGTSFGTPLSQIQCSACGTENPAQARKCMNCGLTLGRICPVCNFQNPPGADYCLECATPLDELSKVLMRTAPGRDHTNKVMKEELVRTKSKDTVYMEQQRTLLDEEEQARLSNLRSQRNSAIRQQRMIMAAIFGAAVIFIVVLIVILTTTH